jgi:hypothetical protein
MFDEIQVRPIAPSEEAQFQQQLQAHHYLGSLRKIGETIWYVASWRGAWVALLCFSAAALKLAARDQWIGWTYRQQYARLRLIANNTRFCMLPGWNIKNMASRVLALCEHRLTEDWSAAYGHPILLLETFVDERHRGTLYRAANWQHVGNTRGFRRVPGGYSTTTQSPKKIFVRCLHPRAQTLLSQSTLEIRYTGPIEAPKLLLSAAQLRALPRVFGDIADPRSVAGRRHSLSSVLTIAAGAYLCGARSCQSMSAWAERLTQSARQGIRCRCERNHYRVPNVKIIREVLSRIDRRQLQHALESWNAQFGVDDASLILHAGELCLDGARHQLCS